MNKTTLIEKVSKDTGVPIKETRLVINSMIDTIKDRLLYGVEVKLKDFVTFKLEISKATKRRNPQTGEEIDVPKRYKVKTIWSRLFTDKLKDKTVY